MKSKLRLVFCGVISICLNFSTNSAFASETNFEYPELSVVPRASEQIVTESNHEKDHPIKTHLPLLVPATATFVTGLALLSAGTKSSEDSTNVGAKYAPWIGMGVGAAWWALSYAVLDHLDYYGEGSSEVAKLPTKTQREQILRERRAEESIAQAGATARRLKWISIISNLGASGFMAGAAKEKTFPVYLAVTSAITAFTPLLFPHRWETVESMQQDYKKRIYAPVIGATLLPSPTHASLLPGLLLALQF